MKKVGRKVKRLKVTARADAGPMAHLAAKHMSAKTVETEHYREVTIRFPRMLADRMSPDTQKECFIDNVRNIIMSQGMSEEVALRIMMSMAISDAMHIVPPEQVEELIAMARHDATKSMKLCGCKQPLPLPVEKRN